MKEKSLFMIKKLYPKALLFIFLFITVGTVWQCAYYNTFYTANKAYNEAEKRRKKNPSIYTEINLPPAQKPAGDESRLYQEAIKKASKVLSHYPKSKWVDDALFLIGKSFYFQTEYSGAERKFREILAGYPKSKFVQESYYFLGLSLFAQEEFAEAEESFQKLIRLPQEYSFRSKASFMLAELQLAQKKYPEAIAYYQEFLNKYKKDKLVPIVHQRLGEVYWNLEEYSRAKDAYQQAARLATDQKVIFECIFKSGECFYKLNQIDEGYQIFSQLSKDERFFGNLSRVKLKIAQGLLLKKEYEPAEKEYEDISVKYPATEEAAQAYLELGSIYLNQKNDLKKAKEFFDKASQQKPNSPFAMEALQKSTNLSKLEEYQKAMSQEETEKSAEIQFLLAELFLTQMNLPDSALAEYRNLTERFPESEYAPKALYAMGWIYQNVLHDSLKASETFKKLIAFYPKSDYSVTAQKNLGSFSDSMSLVSAEILCRKAEYYLFENQNLDSCLALCQKILDEYPKSTYAPKALFTMAWVKENFSTEKDSSIILAYQKVVDTYPNTVYAEQAKSKLGKELKKAPPRTEAPPPDTTPTSQQDTIPAAPLDTLRMAPPPKQLGQFIYPQFLLDRAIEARVIFKIKISLLGTVVSAEIINSSGVQEIDNAARQAALGTIFDPATLDDTNLEGYYRFEIHARPSTAPQ